MPKQKLHTFAHRLYLTMVRSQYALPAIVFILVFTGVAVDEIADKQNFANQFVSAQSTQTADNSGSDSIDIKASDSNNTEGSKDTSKAGETKATGTAAAKTTAAGTAPKTSGTPKTTPAAPAPVPAPAPAAAPAGNWTYPLHTNIRTTYFWAGEAASADNDFIQNVSSAWQTNWAGYFGGEDNPYTRCGYNPCAFAPKENPFYFALPFGDFTESGPVANLSSVYWYNGAAQASINNGQSILKNRWIQITLGNKTAYAQWEDVGPFNSDDVAYVFGSAAPRSSRAGLDVSPAVRDYLGMGGLAQTNWRFVTAAEVPAGPWKTTVTTSGTDWN